MEKREVSGFFDFDDLGLFEPERVSHCHLVCITVSVPDIGGIRVHPRFGELQLNGSDEWIRLLAVGMGAQCVITELLYGRDAPGSNSASASV